MAEDKPERILSSLVDKGMAGDSLKPGLELRASLSSSCTGLLLFVNPETPPAPRLAYEYSWSLGCGVGAGLILLLGGVCFLLLTLPSWPWRSLCPKWGGPTA